MCVHRHTWTREGERESQAGSAFRAEPDVGLNLMTVRSWPELKSRVGGLTNWATQAPQHSIIFLKDEVENKKRVGEKFELLLQLI